MKRMRVGEITDQDKQLTNEHFVEDGKNFPTDPSTATACTTNAERNAVDFMT